jgi:hypothetical protein
MSYDYYTMVKATPGFWKRYRVKQFIGRLKYMTSHIKNDELIATSRNRSMLSDIINLSKEYPHEVFQIKIAGEDVYENYVTLYECTKGESRLVKEGFEYIFGVDVKDRGKLDNAVFQRFMGLVADYYKRYDLTQKNDVKLEISFDEESDTEYDKETKLSIILEYKTKDVCLTAKKLGTTYINVKVEPIIKKKNSYMSECEFLNDDCDELT